MKKNIHHNCNISYCIIFCPKIDFNTINSNNVLTILNNITITENKDLQNYNKVSQMIQIGNSNAIEVYDNSKKQFNNESGWEL